MLRFYIYWKIIIGFLSRNLFGLIYIHVFLSIYCIIILSSCLRKFLNFYCYRNKVYWRILIIVSNIFCNVWLIKLYFKCGYKKYRYCLILIYIIYKRITNFKCCLLTRSLNKYCFRQVKCKHYYIWKISILCRYISCINVANFSFIV